ncbi:MAG: LamG-like jellyroll fold domain-containing protein [Planctomycetota bacterium]|jgi:hypothetical protein
MLFLDSNPHWQSTRGKIGGGLYIGAGKELDAASFFSSQIDDVRIYNQALSASDIKVLAR